VQDSQLDPKFEAFPNESPVLPTFEQFLYQEIADKDMKDVRRKKINAIGTLLERYLIQNPARGLNCDMPLPSIFLSDKLYGPSTGEKTSPGLQNNIFAMNNLQIVQNRITEVYVNFQKGLKEDLSGVTLTDL